MAVSVLKLVVVCMTAKYCGTTEAALDLLSENFM